MNGPDNLTAFGSAMKLLDEDLPPELTLAEPINGLRRKRNPKPLSKLGEVIAADDTIAVDVKYPTVGSKNSAECGEVDRVNRGIAVEIAEETMKLHNFVAAWDTIVVSIKQYATTHNLAGNERQHIAAIDERL